VNEQGFPQVTNSELIADHEAILLELVTGSTITSSWAPATSSPRMRASISRGSSSQRWRTQASTPSVFGNGSTRSNELSR